MGRILAIGGGGFLMESAPSPVDGWIVRHAGGSRPRVCFVSTPSGDSMDMIERFYASYEPLGCVASHLAFFRKPFRNPLPLATYREQLLEQDAIFVGGGNTKSALAVWREWGLDAVLREAWRRGVLLSGMSAGALVWFEDGLTDSYWGAGYRPLRCLGFLPGGCCVHYHGEPERRLRLHEAVRANGGRHVAIDDCAAVLYEGTTMHEVVSWASGATAYAVMQDDRGDVREDALPATDLR